MAKKETYTPTGNAAVDNVNLARRANIESGVGAYAGAGAKGQITPPTPMASTASTAASTPIPAANLKTQAGTYNPPTPPSTYQTTVGVNAVAETSPLPIPAPAQPTASDKKQSLYDSFMGKGADVTQQKDKAREDADLAAKNEAYNRELAALKTRKNAYEDEIEKLEENKEGLFGGALQQRVDDLRRKANKDLAYMAVGVELAQNNYLGAEKILNDQIQDIQQDYDNDFKTFQVGMDFLQNDLTESEKLQASQAFEREQTKTQFDLNELAAQRDFVRQKGLISYKNGLDNASGVNAPKIVDVDGKSMIYDANTGNFVPAPTSGVTEDNSEVLGQISRIDELLNGGQLENVVGINKLNPFTYIPGTKVQYAKNQFNQIKSDLSLENREKLKGSGAISDFEFKVLGQAASALGSNLSNEDATKELKKIKSVFNSAAGIPTVVKITDPSTGQSVTVQASRDSINRAIIDGATVEYQ